jgi:hypothetical protein
MALRDNFSLQTDDASMMAKLHLKNGLELIDLAKADGNEPARLSAGTAVSHANSALKAFYEATGLLPDLAAALKVKRSGDITLLESGSWLNVARRDLETAVET